MSHRHDIRACVRDYSVDLDMEPLPVVTPVGSVEADEVAALGLVFGLVHVLLGRALAALDGAGIGELITAIALPFRLEALARRPPVGFELLWRGPGQRPQSRVPGELCLVELG